MVPANIVLMDLTTLELPLSLPKLPFQLHDPEIHLSQLFSEICAPLFRLGILLSELLVLSGEGL